MGAVYAGLLLERSDAFCATTPHHQIVRTVCQITSSLGHVPTAIGALSSWTGVRMHSGGTLNLHHKAVGLQYPFCRKRAVIEFWSVLF